MNRSLFALLSLSLLLLTGCQCYHVGSSLPPEERAIAIAAIENRTREHRLTPLVKDDLAEKLSGIPGISVVSENDAAAGQSVKVVLLALDQNRHVSAEVREKAARKDDSNAYQTVLYRAVLAAEWTATTAAGDSRTGKAEVTADVPVMPDLDIAFSAALRELSRALANEIAANLTER